MDIKLPAGAALSETDRATREAERVIQDITTNFDRVHKSSSSDPPALASITSLIGGGGPRFWFSVTPEAPAPNYAQLLVQFTRSEDTNKLVGPLQEALSARVAGARIDVRTVETGPPTLSPLSSRGLGEEARTLRAQAEQLKDI